MAKEFIEDVNILNKVSSNFAKSKERRGEALESGKFSNRNERQQKEDLNYENWFPTISNSLQGWKWEVNRGGFSKY